MSEKAKQRHVDAIVSYLLDGAQLMAMRYYTENRVSRATFEEARTKAARLKKFYAEKQKDV